MRGLEATVGLRGGNVTREVPEPAAGRQCNSPGRSTQTREVQLARVARVEELARVTVVATILAAPALAALGARFEIVLLTRTAGFSVVFWIVAVLTLVVTGWFDIAVDLCGEAEARRDSMFSSGGGA